MPFTEQRQRSLAHGASVCYNTGMTTPTRRPKFARKDVAEIAMGCCIMAFPVATTEEIWKLGEELSYARVLLFVAASISFLALIIYHVYHVAEVEFDRREFLRRVLSTYGLTLAISALILFSVDRLELVDHAWVGVKRTILVAFPASFAATAVDSFL
jgi:uncharacterized membrane protein